LVAAIVFPTQVTRRVIAGTGAQEPSTPHEHSYSARSIGFRAKASAECDPHMQAHESRAANRLPPQRLGDSVWGRFGWRKEMKLDRFGPAYQPAVLSLFRFMTGLLLFQYGVAKIFKVPALPYFANPPPLIMTAGALELVLGALLMLGLFTRLAAFILSGEMAFAYFLGHMLKTGEPVLHPLNNGGTAAILFCFACLYLATAGGGAFSVDAAMQKRGEAEHLDDVHLGHPAE
jgi:putative oxidoreductase